MLKDDIWHALPSAAPSRQVSSSAVHTVHESSNISGVAQTFPSTTFDLRVDELAQQLQLQRVKRSHVACNDLASDLIQQSVAVGRNADAVLSAICASIGTATDEGSFSTAEHGGIDVNAPRDPASAPFHTAGFSDLRHSVDTYHANDTVVPHGNVQFANPIHPEAGNTCFIQKDPRSNNSNGWKGISLARDQYLRRGPHASHGSLASLRSPRLSAEHSSMIRPADTRGPFGRIQYPNMRPTPSASIKPIKASLENALITEGALSVRKNDPKPSLTTASVLATGTQATGFVPMLAVTRPDMTGRDVTPMPLGSQTVQDLKFSPRYHGMHTETNASVDYLRPDQNCALWITQLPPDVKVTEILGHIHNAGRVYATFINPPDGIKHPRSAAKLVFFTPAGAQKLLAYAWHHPFTIRGYKAQVAPNRIKYDSHSTAKGESRVLIITGDKKFVNEGSLTAYFEGRFAFQIDKIQTLIEFKNRAVVEYKFGSYRCQSQMGFKALLLDRPRGLEMVEFGADPCEVGSDTTSFTIAGERIQGKGLLLPNFE
ncbi:hypothetical protein NOR_06350 [Metarhizium rileyi]|uniref:Uncharacterized protein n=1 Tax=Metarhizium rileyi (strain RCEF 4871) TaxID=1649241 RepID=A0A167AN29_METRR|nr:hypothetical protein NOR_06350 [Metarhizium rileyi RCEF 4871]